MQGTRFDTRVQVAILYPSLDALPQRLGIAESLSFPLHPALTLLYSQSRSIDRTIIPTVQRFNSRRARM